MSNVTSQSELTTKEIVEQAISDYHESILPYLNGQVPTIANKFDKANLYSTDEQIVGRWIDGKPLYQKTVNCGALPNASEKSVSIGVSNIECICKASGIAIKSDKSDFLILPTVNDKYMAEQVALYISNTSIGLGNRDKDKSSYTAYVTIQYTKTTDEAIAIGSDTDYSTTEKIVGTWTDGKPVYQKTVQGTTTNYKGGSASVNIGLVIDNIVSLDGYIVINDTNSGDLGGFVKIGGDVTSCGISYDKQKVTVYQNWDSAVNKSFYITIQYTKTTD